MLARAAISRVELDRLDDRFGLCDDFLEALLGCYDRDGQRVNRHAFREVDEVETGEAPLWVPEPVWIQRLSRSSLPRMACRRGKGDVDRHGLEATDARSHGRRRLEVGIGDELLRDRSRVGRRREQRGPAVRCAPRVVGDRIGEPDAILLRCDPCPYRIPNHTSRPSRDWPPAHHVSHELGAETETSPSLEM